MVGPERPILRWALTFVLLIAPATSAAENVWMFPYWGPSSWGTTNHIEATLADVGATLVTSYDHDWDQDWTAYRMVVIMDPDGEFTLEQSLALQAFVVSGGRLVLTGSWNDPFLGDLLDQMGLPISLGDLAIDPPPRTCYVGTDIMVDGITEGITSFNVEDTTEIIGGTPLLIYDGIPLLSVAQPPGAPARAPYDVVVVGDKSFLGPSACTRDFPDTLWQNLYCPDADQDGHFECNDDCDDADVTVSPSSPELCNGLDDDCDGADDNGILIPWYADTDGDGYGDVTVRTDACDAPVDHVLQSGDCDDHDAAISPVAPDLCDGLDQDCDGVIDNAGPGTWFADSDGDGFGDPLVTIEECAAPDGYVGDASDCDDTTSLRAPDHTEVCDTLDNDCDSLVDEEVLLAWYADHDADGFGDPAAVFGACTLPVGYVADATDCDDTTALRAPVLVESCDTLDNDCDLQIDEGVLTTWFLDADADGRGDAAVSIDACAQPSAYVIDYGDCDDTNASRSPDAVEVCDTLDNDCDSAVDEGLESTWYADRDADGAGDAATFLLDCIAPGGYVADGTDCDDLSADRTPGAAERCDSLDNDCDSLVDEEVTTRFWADTDGDGDGDALVPLDSCAPPTGYAPTDTDCDDTDDGVAPSLAEVCDGRDNDCDLEVDEGATTPYYADTDADGFGDPEVSVPACEPLAGYVPDATDCWDGSATRWPGAPELADGQDNDCDGTVDEGTDSADDDGDGYSEEGGDCDDADPDRAPGEAEIADGADQDCDGQTDEDTEISDDDGDGRSETGGDCNDADAARSPDLTEIADNGLDDDCDGTVDDGLADPDGDGYMSEAGDCAADDGTIYPGAPELPDGVDNDCDGEVDEGTVLDDGDLDGWTELEGDCDDTNPTVGPSASEIPNGTDDDCDGHLDEGTAAYDDDADGITEEGGDCDDQDPARSPTASETLDGVDNDCDGEVDEGTSDLDSDGVTRENGDCNDNDGWVRPNLPEMCDHIDNNCDGIVDEGCDTPTIADTSAKSDPADPGCGGGTLSGLGVLGLTLRRRKPKKTREP